MRRGGQRNTFTRNVLHRVGSEMKKNPPRILRKTAKKFGAKRAAKQRTAILLSKARREGANVPY